MLALAVLMAGLAPPTEAQSSFFEDARFGFKIKPPRDWEPIPIQTGEGWLVAKYLSDKSYHYNVDGWSWDFEPEMLVIAFLSEELLEAAEEAREAELKKAVERLGEKEREKREKEGGDDPPKDTPEDAPEDPPEEGEAQPEDEPGSFEVLWTFGRRYKDYKDYLAATYRGGGYYFSVEEQSEQDELPITQYEIKVEKLANSGPKRIVTRIYHLEDVDIAVQFEVLEDSYDKLDRTLARSFDSFKQIPRTASLPQDQAAGMSVRISFGDLISLTPQQRVEKRKLSEQQQHDQAIANLTEGWTSERMGSFLVLSHTDAKYAKRAVDHGESVLKFLEATFPYVGPEEYVRAPILRICRDYDELSAFFSGSGSWSFNNLEITLAKSENFIGAWEFNGLSQQLAQHWFSEKDVELWSACPEWLQFGITSLIGESSEKSGRLDFQPEQFTRDRLREIAREDRATHVRALMHMTMEDFFGGSGMDGWDRTKEAQALVEFLLVGKGSKGSTKNLIHDYLANLRLVIAERSAQNSADTDGASGFETPETEEEEAELLRKRRESWRSRERELLEELSRRTFAGWSTQDWDKLDKNYRRSL